MDGITETTELADPVRLAAARRGVIRAVHLETLQVRAQEMEWRYVGRRSIAGAGVQQEVAVVTEMELGDRIKTEYLVADDGRFVEISQGEGVVMRPEPEAQARSLEAVDLFALISAPLPGPVPRDVPATVVYRLQGLPAAFAVDDGRQKFEKARDGATLLTVAVRAPVAADPARDTPLHRAAQGADPEDLEATGEVDADNPAIVALARQVAGDAPGAYAAAVRLAQHVHGRLRPAYGASHDRASEVLAAGQGDCSEHAILTAALTRALGIPTRKVQGLVYAPYVAGRDALYWHAWVEVRSAGEWIAIDPIFDQPVADASHITLGRNNRVDTPGLFGALKVTALEIREPRAAGKVRPASAAPGK
ncbi:MAG: transglutaminase-like domain-containing protein [Anaeromyxobacter sp.]